MVLDDSVGLGWKWFEGSICSCWLGVRVCWVFLLLIFIVFFSSVILIRLLFRCFIWKVVLMLWMVLLLVCSCSVLFDGVICSCRWLCFSIRL